MSSSVPSWYRLSALFLGSSFSSAGATTLVQASSVPLVADLGGDWGFRLDADGNGAFDVSVHMAFASGPIGTYYGAPSSTYWFIAMHPNMGGAFVFSGLDEKLANLAPGVPIGPDLANFMGGAYRFRTGLYPTASVTEAFRAGQAPVSINRFGFEQETEALIGFQFESEGNVHYAWARLSYVFAPGARKLNLTIHDAWYNAGAGESIRAGEVPEPGGLGLLALGAAGILRRRRCREQDAVP